MLFRLFRRDPQADTIAALYGAIVAQARRPAFYLAYGVPDTAEGRFEMIVLHLALLCRRLGRAEPVAGPPERAQAHSLSQGVFDMFCRDMDHNLREMGVTDVGVPKKMRKLGEAFYGRLGAYDRALAAEDADALATALVRNVHGGASAVTPVLARYARRAAQRLDTAPTADLLAGRVSFPEPEAIVAGVQEAET